MSRFLTGKALEEKLTDIIWDAKKYVIVMSPFIRLDNHVRSIFDKVKSGHEVSLYLMFGKNEGYKNKSFRQEDYDYFKEFKNIAILYNRDLHAKHYCNEKEGLVTSLNLYDYSMINNIEYGVHFTKNYNPSDQVFKETEVFTDELLFEKSEVVFLKKPQYKKKLMGLTKSYQSSKILYDISDQIFRGRRYEIKHLTDFDFEELQDIDKQFDTKPIRSEKTNYKPKTGYCIRTGVEIEFNPEKPLSLKAYREWAYYENYNYPENYCHKTGKRSYGKTSMNKPIL
jgi:hypothetical protein